MLIEIGVSTEQFLAVAKIGLENQDHKKYFEQIIACDNFLYFKSKMVMRNAQIKEEAYKLYAAQENKTSQNELTYDEHYNALLKIKENTELECALAMSLALVEEKTKIMGGDEDLELLKAIEESKKLINNRSNQLSGLEYDAPISLFDRNTLKLREQNHPNEGPAAPLSYDQINKITSSMHSVQQQTQNIPQNKNKQLEFSTPNNVEIKSQEKKVTSTFNDLTISANNFSENAKVNQNKNKIEMQKTSDLNIESKKDSNNVWKDGLNKQVNIDLAILSTQSKPFEDKNKPKNILEMVGNVGSYNVTEKSQVSSTQVPEDLFDNYNNKSSNSNINSNSNTHENKLFDQKGVSSQAQNSSNYIQGTSENTNNQNNMQKISVETKQSNKEIQISDQTSGITSNKVDVGGKLNKNIKSQEIDNIEFSSKLDFSKTESKIDNNADVSDLQKWKNYEKKDLDHSLPDLTTVKSKIDTGLNQIKNIDKEFKKENDDLKKKFELLQKEKENKIKEYRDMLLKMKMDKSKDEMKDNVSFIIN